jgi:hypothetical protein
MVFVRANVGISNVGDPESMFTVQYFDEKDNMTIRSGGTRAWRCNNPGNLHRSSYSMGKGRRAIGFAGDVEDEYAVYPDYRTGHEALIVMLSGSIYFPLTLRLAMKRYDKKNVKYIDEIVKITGFDPERTIKSLTNHEFEKFWKAIEQVEKWREGREDFIEKWVISSVCKKRGVITDYLVLKKNTKTWVSKEQAIQFAIIGHLRVVIVHLKNGTNYLRPQHKEKTFYTLT